MSPDQERGGRSSAPLRWVFRIGWDLHRAGYAISGGRLGLRSATGDRLGTLWKRVRARLAEGAERGAPGRRFIQQLAEYQRYAERAEREIPVVILEPIVGEADA